MQESQSDAENVGGDVDNAKFAASTNDFVQVPGTRVLVIEDNPEHLYLLTTHLARAGCIVTSAASAEEAMDEFAEAAPHITFLDVQLPGMTGFGFLDWLKSSEHPPCMVVTTSVLDPADHPLGDAALPKPFTGRQIHKLLDSWHHGRAATATK